MEEHNGQMQYNALDAQNPSHRTALQITVFFLEAVTVHISLISKQFL